MNAESVVEASEVYVGYNLGDSDELVVSRVAKTGEVNTAMRTESGILFRSYIINSDTSILSRTRSVLVGRGDGIGFTKLNSVLRSYGR